MHCLFQRLERWYQIKGQFNSLPTATIKAVLNYPSSTCLLFSKSHQGSFLPQDFTTCCGKYDNQNRILKLLCCLQEVCYRKERGGVFTNRRQITTEPSSLTYKMTGSIYTCSPTPQPLFPRIVLWLSTRKCLPKWAGWWKRGPCSQKF